MIVLTGISSGQLSPYDILWRRMRASSYRSPQDMSTLAGIFEQLLVLSFDGQAPRCIITQSLT